MRGVADVARTIDGDRTAAIVAWMSAGQAGSADGILIQERKGGSRGEHGGEIVFR
jgi:hypothetical protein